MIGESENLTSHTFSRSQSSFNSRLFSQPSADDARHDEALSSRVAALNMLDLGLEHLDVDVGDAADDIGTVIRACGESRCPFVTFVRLASLIFLSALSQLDAVCRCPADNAAVLVAAHKVVVGKAAAIHIITSIAHKSLRRPVTSSAC